VTYCRAGDVLTYTTWVMVTVFSTAVAAGNIQYINPNTGGYDASASELSATGVAPALNTWYAVTRSYTITAAGVKTMGVYYTQKAPGVGGGDCYVDAASAVVLPSGTSAPSTFLRGSGGATNWLAGLRLLAANGGPPTTYQVTLLDLHRLNPTVWSLDVLVLGGTVTVTDTDLGVSASPRVVQVTTNHLAPLDTTVTLSTRRPELTTLLLAG